MAEYLAVVGCFKEKATGHAKEPVTTERVRGYLEAQVDNGLFRGEVQGATVHSFINDENLAWFLGRSFPDDTTLVNVVREMNLPRAYTVLRAEVIDAAQARSVARRIQETYGGRYQFYSSEEF